MTKSVMQEGLLKPRNKARVLTIDGFILDGYCHGLINYIDTKAKCRHLKKLTCKGTLRAGIYLSETPYPLKFLFEVV